MITREEITEFFKWLQQDIIRQLEEMDGKGKFVSDPWDRPGGGGGITRVLANGNIIEKGGVNFSAVWGEMPQNIAKKLQLEANEFYATGVSLVLHPENPMVPIIHMNVRYFEMGNGEYWFGGGIDLTPHYIVDEDAKFFHEELKKTCDKHNPNFYTDYKKWADDYFYLTHRKETRGVGGIFFDRLKHNDRITKEQLFEFVKDVGNTFCKVYVPIASKHANDSYTDAHKKWQKVRRGRYVEFNLIYDKGTKFGIDTDGRTESIFISLPPEVEWHYNYPIADGSEEAVTQAKLVKGKDWMA